MIKHLISITDLTKTEFVKIIKLGIKLKKQIKKDRQTLLLKNKTLVMIFEKPSLRTRLSFEMGMTQLGGHTIYLATSDIGIGKREPVSDVAKVTSSMANIIMVRTFKHKTVENLAKHSQVPVINGLSDLEHPCQILADFMTIYEEKGRFKGLNIAFVGDGKNNVVHSMALASSMLGVNFRCASPKGYFMKKDILKNALKTAKKTKSKIKQFTKPEDAVKNADIVVTDTWVSMGDEKEEQKRLKVFKKYQVNKKLFSLAKKNAIFMHCLPAHRGKEVTKEIIDGKSSVVFQEAENRLHAQKALLLFLQKSCVEKTFARLTGLEPATFRVISGHSD